MYEIFNECLRHIRLATLNIGQFEIIIIDNNSTNKFTEQKYFLDFKENVPNVKLVKENKQGLTPARLRAINESKGNLLVFIDDDNFVDKHFFNNGLDIAYEYPLIGAWSGQVLLKFEKEPEIWTERYWGLLVYRKLEKDYWSNLPFLSDTMPCGAGLFVRKVVALKYSALHDEGKRNIQLDRTKNSLFSGGDNDLAMCACDCGLGVGLFERLKLDHYIPAKRMNKEYLLKLTEGISASDVVLKYFRGGNPAVRSFKNHIADFIRILLKKPIDRSFYKAHLTGIKKGNRIVKNNKV